MKQEPIAMRRHILLLLLLLAPIAGGGCMDLDSFLYNTEKLDRYALPGNTIPDSLLEQVSLQSDGHTLYGYWVTPPGEPRGMTILYCHGNKHNLDAYWDRAMILHRLGFNLFIFDYRGFGMSEGSSSEAGMYADAEAALDYVRARGVSPDSLCLYGFSLGNVASIYLAARKVDPRCLIAESPFASADALAQGATGLDIPPRWLTEGTHDNASLIEEIRAPFLLMHGEEDDFVRYRDNGRVVYENAPEPKRLVLVPRAVHTDVPQQLGIERYLDEVRGWIEKGE
jgi:fermentation-respiration switch protein FrsA (DUF1100 family)